MFTFLNPARKGKKYAYELKQKMHFTNNAKPKVTKDGEVKKLTKSEASYRMGYLQARKDSAKAYLANKKKRKRKKF